MVTEFDVPVFQGKQRPKFNAMRKTAYTPPETRQAERAVAEAYQSACMTWHGYVPMAPKGAPVRLVVKAWRPLPESRPKRVLVEDDVCTPDWDNIGKLVSDALNGIAYHDDCQIVDARVIKERRCRGAEPLTRVTVSWPDEPRQLRMEVPGWRQ